jgi:hypothetical protein
MVGNADITPLAPPCPGAPSYITGKITVLLAGLNRFDPLTVSVTVTPVDDEPGVTTTDAVDAVVGVPPDIAQAYVGEVILLITAVKVALVGVNAPAAFCTNPVNPDISIDGPEVP